MAEAVPMLALSPTMTEGTIAAWKYKEGDTVTKGSVLCEVETDKAVMDYESSSAGELLKILVGEGGNAAVGDIIAVIGKKGEDIESLLENSSPTEAEPKAAEGKNFLPAPVSFVSRSSDTGSLSGGPALAPGYPPSSPLARVLARDAGIDLRGVTPSGPGGRVVARDIKAMIASNSAGKQGVSGPGKGDTGKTHGIQGDKPGELSTLTDLVLPVSRMRATIAKRLGQSVREAPHYFLRSAIEADRLLELRRNWNEGKKEDDKLSLNALFVKLTAMAIAQNPRINVFWLGDTMEYRRSVDIGLAVALPEGLVAPVVRDCTHKSAMEIEQEFRVRIAKAKNGTLLPEDYEGASFTISNLGAWGIEEFTAIINPPGSAILALGAIMKEGVVMPDETGKEAVLIRSMLRATLSCDHRSIDGAVGAAFMRDLKEMIQEPGRGIL